MISDPIRLKNEMTDADPLILAKFGDCAIAVSDHEDLTTRRLISQFEGNGFRVVSKVDDLNALAIRIRSGNCSIIVLDLDLEMDVNKSLVFLEQLRKHGFLGIVVVLSRKTTLQLFFRAAKSGANDFLIRGRNLDVVAETIRLLNQSSFGTQSDWCPERIVSVGFLNSLGITDSEKKLLVEFSRGFHRYQSLASRVGTSERSVRKSFSRIYKKLNHAFELDNLAQLSHVLTICSMYNQKVFIKALTRGRVDLQKNRQDAN